MQLIPIICRLLAWLDKSPIFKNQTSCIVEFYVALKLSFASRNPKEFCTNSRGELISCYLPLIHSRDEVMTYFSKCEDGMFLVWLFHCCSYDSYELNLPWAMLT